MKSPPFFLGVWVFSHNRIKNFKVSRRCIANFSTFSKKPLYSQKNAKKRQFAQKKNENKSFLLCQVFNLKNIEILRDF